MSICKPGHRNSAGESSGYRPSPGSGGGLQGKRRQREPRWKAMVSPPEPADERGGDPHLAGGCRQRVAVTRGDGGEEPMGILAEKLPKVSALDGDAHRRTNADLRCGHGQTSIGNVLEHRSEPASASRLAKAIAPRAAPGSGAVGRPPTWPNTTFSRQLPASPRPGSEPSSHSSMPSLARSRRGGLGGRRIGYTEQPDHGVGSMSCPSVSL